MRGRLQQHQETGRLNVELQLEIRFVSTDLKRSHGNDLRAIESADEFVSAYPRLAMAGFDLVILHSSRLVGNRAVDPFAMDRNRGGDVAHVSSF